MQAHGFRVCFTPLLEVLFTFPSRYLCAIGLSVVFSLTGWSPQIPAEFLVLRGTQVPPFRVRGCHPLWPRFPACSAMDHISCCRRSYNPGRCHRQPRFGLLRVRSPLLAQSLLLSFPPGTKMFQFPGFAPGVSQMPESLPAGFPIRTSAGHRVFAPHRGFSQLITSFSCSLSFYLFRPAAAITAPLKAPHRAALTFLHTKTRSIFTTIISKIA